jgi:hypothetical protein
VRHWITKITVNDEGEPQLGLCLPRVGMQVRNVCEEAAFVVMDVSLIDKMMTLAELDPQGDQCRKPHRSVPITSDWQAFSGG